MFCREVDKINLSGIEYPIACDMVVLEEIQETYGSIEAAEDGILNWKYAADENGDKIPTSDGFDFEKIVKFPNVKTVNHLLFLMINEGAELSGKEPPFKDEKEVSRMVDLSLYEIADLVHEEFMKCFIRKNQQATQGEMETETVR